MAAYRAPLLNEEGIAKLGTMSDVALAKSLGVSYRALARERVARGIPAFSSNRPWAQAELQMFGKHSDADADADADAEVARLTGRTKASVTMERTMRKIPGYFPRGVPAYFQRLTSRLNSPR